jgi:serine acetyltransferase
VVADNLPNGTAVLGVPARVVDLGKVVAPGSLHRVPPR